MSLRDTAAADFTAFVEDAGAFGWPITVTDPAGTSVQMTGLSTDIHLMVDPVSGQAIVGRNASVALSIGSLLSAGLSIPVGVANQSGLPWVVSFADVNGASHTFKVSEAMPDRAIGAVVCSLEFYKV